VPSELIVTDVQFSEMTPPTFDLASRLTIECVEHLRSWNFPAEGNRPPSVKIGVEFWADEAVEQCWI
jgi:hypothetical protein